MEENKICVEFLRPLDNFICLSGSDTVFWIELLARLNDRFKDLEAAGDREFFGFFQRFIQILVGWRFDRAEKCAIPCPNLNGFSSFFTDGSAP